MDRSQIEEIRIEDYDYPLPDQRIARHPLAERDNCLLLVRDPQGGLSTRRFSDLPALLPPDSMLVYNNTRVINARLRFRKGSDGTGSLIEIFCLERDDPADYAVSLAAECDGRRPQHHPARHTPEQGRSLLRRALQLGLS